MRFLGGGDLQEEDYAGGGLRGEYFRVLNKEAIYKEERENIKF